MPLTTQLRTRGLGVTLVWVDCDVETMHTYLRRRGAARDSIKLGDWDGYLAKIDIDFRHAAEHLVSWDTDSHELAVPSRRIHGQVTTAR